MGAGNESTVFTSIITPHPFEKRNLNAVNTNHDCTNSLPIVSSLFCSSALENTMKNTMFRNS